MDIENHKKWYNRIWLLHEILWLYVALTTSYWDIKNFFRFRKQMKGFAADPNSQFSKFGLKVNWLGNMVYTQYDLGRDRALYMTDRQKTAYLIDLSRLTNSYLCDDLAWRDYILTDFIDFTDLNTGEISGSYGVTFTFTPISLTNMKMYRMIIFIAILATVGYYFLK